MANKDFDNITRQILEDALNYDHKSIEGKILVEQLHEACGFEQVCISTHRIEHMV